MAMMERPNQWISEIRTELRKSARFYQGWQTPNHSLPSKDHPKIERNDSNEAMTLLVGGPRTAARIFPLPLVPGEMIAPVKVPSWPWFECDWVSST